MNALTNPAYEEFKKRFKSFIKRNPDLIKDTLSNIFSMRIIGNKTHGDLAEIGISEFINRFLCNDFRSEHVGKDLFRRKKHEEDIRVKILKGTQKGAEIPISLKAYGVGPLQLSTDKDQGLFGYLKEQGECIKNKKAIRHIFSEIYTINVLPLIYDEKKEKCNIMVFDFEKAYKNTAKIIRVDEDKKFDGKKIVVSKGRKHPIYLFVDAKGQYICEVRYGNAAANALQRGLWTNTKNAESYFESLTKGWISYSTNKTLVELFSIALNASEEGQKKANKLLLKDIERLNKK